MMKKFKLVRLARATGPVRAPLVSGRGRELHLIEGSKAPAISRLSRLATCWFPQFQIVCVCSVRSSRAVRVPPWCLAPI
jgi:hypothetical protein